MKDGRVDRSCAAIPEITVATAERFSRLGLVGVLGNLITRIRPYAFGQYLTGRYYDVSKARPPSTPFGFLLNIAVKTPDLDATSTDSNTDWTEALDLARDLTAVLDVEPYNKFWPIGNAPKRLDPLLNEIGLYDHLFGLRQGSIFVTPLLLESFLGLGMITH